MFLVFIEAFIFNLDQRKSGNFFSRNLGRERLEIW